RHGLRVALPSMGAEVELVERAQREVVHQREGRRDGYRSRGSFPYGRGRCIVVAGEEDTARGAVVARQAVEPGDDVLVLLLQRLRKREELGERAEAPLDLADPGSRDTHEADFRPRDEAREPEAPDGRAKELRVRAGTALEARAIGAQQLEAWHVMAEGPCAMVVLAVDVVGDGAADRHEPRARRDRKEEAARQREGRDFREQHARLAAQRRGGRIERDEAIEVARAQDGAAVVEARIAIAAARAVRQDRAAIIGKRQSLRAVAHARHALPRVEDAAPGAVAGRLDHVAAIITASAAAATSQLARSRTAKSTGSSCICPRAASSQMREIQ